MIADTATPSGPRIFCQSERLNPAKIFCCSVTPRSIYWVNRSERIIPQIVAMITPRTPALNAVRMIHEMMIEKERDAIIILCLSDANIFSPSATATLSAKNAKISTGMVIPMNSPPINAGSLPRPPIANGIAKSIQSSMMIAHVTITGRRTGKKYLTANFPKAMGVNSPSRMHPRAPATKKGITTAPRNRSLPAINSSPEKASQIKAVSMTNL